MTTAPVSSGPNKLLIALIAIGGVLLLSITAIVFLLVGQNSSGTGTLNAGDQAPVTDSSTPPTTAADPADGDAADGQTGDGTSGGESSGGGGGQAPVDNSLRFTSFNYNAQVACDPTGNDEKPSPSISWSSANAVHVYWSPSDDEANAEDYEVGASGNQDDMSFSKGEGERYEFPCNHRQTFDTTITLVGANGQTVSKHVTFTDINWNTGGDDDEDF